MDLPIVDILIPTTGSPVGLGATLAALAGQRYPSFRILAARPPLSPSDEAQLSALAAVLKAGGHGVRVVDFEKPPADGGRLQALVDASEAPYVLVVEDGVYLEPDLLGRLVAAIRATHGGFIGSNVIDLRFRDEHRPEDESIEFWDGPVRPEEIGVGGRGWERRRIHRGANLQHLRERLPRTRDRLYRVADIQGCVLYDAAKLRAVGGFRAARDHGQNPAIPVGRVAATQLRLLARDGGAGLFPSGAYRLAPVGTSGEADVDAGPRRDSSPVAGTAPDAAGRNPGQGRDRRPRRVRHAVPRHRSGEPRRGGRRHGSASLVRRLVVRR